jgi:hypothetical protein
LDSCGDEIVSAAAEIGYDRYGFEGNPGNVGQDRSHE